MTYEKALPLRPAIVWIGIGIAAPPGWFSTKVTCVRLVVVSVIVFFDIRTLPTTITTALATTTLVGATVWMPSRWMWISVSSGFLFYVQLTVCFSAGQAALACDGLESVFWGGAGS